ncbi:MAG: hypothetical protein C4617_05820 [Candidatus Liberibacter europaeus]|uniref:Uncharacterized protein n=1 Tax=Candidatus Liberibacter europaeus TaxID=744859 RepID=A0A2T4VWB5_9HYPH|nr:hypothetical protein [Candidatus Liberibacter europaeus]PTL86068.1 MAG: hypothetical protein C4617_05820 [Candidatus Liberibacter europaeus]
MSNMTDAFDNNHRTAFDFSLLNKRAIHDSGRNVISKLRTIKPYLREEIIQTIDKHFKYLDTVFDRSKQVIETLSDPNHQQQVKEDELAIWENLAYQFEKKASELIEDGDKLYGELSKELTDPIVKPMALKHLEEKYKKCSDAAWDLSSFILAWVIELRPEEDYKEEDVIVLSCPEDCDKYYNEFIA